MVNRRQVGQSKLISCAFLVWLFDSFVNWTVLYNYFLLFRGRKLSKCQKDPTRNLSLKTVTPWKLDTSLILLLSNVPLRLWRRRKWAWHRDFISIGGVLRATTPNIAAKYQVDRMLVSRVTADCILKPTTSENAGMAEHVHWLCRWLSLELQRDAKAILQIVLDKRLEFYWRWTKSARKIYRYLLAAEWELCSFWLSCTLSLVVLIKYCSTVADLSRQSG